jgi:hypothetical protein
MPSAVMQMLLLDRLQHLGRCPDESQNTHSLLRTKVTHRRALRAVNGKAAIAASRRSTSVPLCASSCMRQNGEARAIGAGGAQSGIRQRHHLIRPHGDVPKLRSGDAFAAVEKRTVNHDNHCKFRHPAVDRHRFPDLLVPHQNCGAANPERFADAWNKEDQPDAGIVQKVVKGIDAAIADAIWDGECLVIKGTHETRRITPRRHVDLTEGAGRADHDERRFGYEPAARAVEPGEGFAGEPSVRRTDDFPQLRFGGD